MPYSTDYRASARRHLLAAEALNVGARPDVAGYLFGISAESAIKAMMLDCGMRPKAEELRRSDPFYAHFPDLRTMLRDALQGRRGTPLVAFIQDDRYLANWSTKMRYAPGHEVQDRWIANWSEQAKQSVAAIGT